MVFVHARNATVKTAMTLREMATNQGDAALFHPPQSPEYGQAEKQVQHAYNVRLRESVIVKKRSYGIIKLTSWKVYEDLN